jgi:hypothetical protein
MSCVKTENSLLFCDNGEHNKMTGVTITGLYFKGLIFEEN